MSTIIVIPARWGSSRFPGKPLVEIAGHSLLHRTIDLAARASRRFPDIRIVVATDDIRIADHVQSLNCDVAMTDPQITTGSGRALAAALGRSLPPIHVCNLQGDAPFLPVSAVCGVLEVLRGGRSDCVTALTQLDWRSLDLLRRHKQRAPSSGTTCVRAEDGRAIWFSKAILPALRDEEILRVGSALSPIYRHFGIYGYALPVLQRFDATAPTTLERLEGLEQLRLLEMRVTIDTVVTQEEALPIGGIDVPADVIAAERMIAERGDPFGL